MSLRKNDEKRKGIWEMSGVIYISMSYGLRFPPHENLQMMANLYIDKQHGHHHHPQVYGQQMQVYARKFG